jgi:hypothetical protein
VDAAAQRLLFFFSAHGDFDFEESHASICLRRRGAEGWRPVALTACTTRAGRAEMKQGLAI